MEEDIVLLIKNVIVVTFLKGINVRFIKKIVSWEMKAFVFN